MYTEKNYQSKKQLVEDFKAGKTIRVYQPGGMFPLRDGAGVVEGPHYPQPHRFYVQVVQHDGVIVSIKGVKSPSPITKALATIDHRRSLGAVLESKGVKL